MRNPGLSNDSILRIAKSILSQSEESSDSSRVKGLIEGIIRDGSGMVYTDKGNGSGGPGYMGPDDLMDSLEAGSFDDAIIVSFDAGLVQETFDSVGLLEDLEDTEASDWVQIEFNRDEKASSNPYYMIGWLWE